MYSLSQRQAAFYRALVLGVAAQYVAITSAVSLLHNDWPAGHRAENSEPSLPSTGPCPACKFLAGSNSAEMQYDSGPALVASPLPPESIQESVIVLADPRTGSILLRAPPSTSLS